MGRKTYIFSQQHEPHAEEEVVAGSTVGHTALTKSFNFGSMAAALTDPFSLPQRRGDHRVGVKVRVRLPVLLLVLSWRVSPCFVLS
jgi:hypothetical protein